MRLPFYASAAAITILATPAVAHNGHPPSVSHHADVPYPGGPHYDDRYHGQYEDYDPAARAWLADCRQRLASRDSGIGGAVIGGVVGGIAGNRIAGRGNRTVGTVAGAAVGAAAGAVIDRAEDMGRNRDECEAYLSDYYADYQHGNGGRPGYGYGYGQQVYYPGYGYQGYGYAAQGCCMAQPMMMVPVMRPEPECTETVEYVYEDVPTRSAPRQRYVPKRTKIVPDKRVKIVPEKLIKAQ